MGALLLYVDTALGRFGLCAGESGLTRVLFPGEKPPEGCAEGSSPLLEEAARQFSAYFGGALKVFDVPLAPVGTPFMHSVWAALRSIPCGDVSTYGDIARKVGSPRAARAVGAACARNPLPVIVPCHRVLGSNGKLTGFAGGLEVKERLLNLERAHG